MKTSMRRDCDSKRFFASNASARRNEDLDEKGLRLRQPYIASNNSSRRNEDLDEKGLRQPFAKVYHLVNPYEGMKTSMRRDCDDTQPGHCPVPYRRRNEDLDEKGLRQEALWNSLFRKNLKE